MDVVNRKMMLIGLFLSKFDQAGLKELGFSGFWEAYNTFALALGGRAKSINNYRDEFDPYFDNPRKGWADRPLRPSRREAMEEYENLSLTDFAAFIRKEVSELGDLEETVNPKKKGDEADSFAKRMMTGQSAERFFELHYAELPVFKKSSVQRTTALGCGFDFKVSSEEYPYYAVEVKGLGPEYGQFLMTEKEYQIADSLRDRYFLYVVRGFNTPHPFPSLIRNPIMVSNELQLHQQERTETLTFWNGAITKHFTK